VTTRVGRIVVVGLGPAGPDLLTTATADAIRRVPARFVRTTRHPSASAVEPATSFDDVYESAPSVDDVYPTIVERLVEAVGREGEVLYAVPGSPAVAERTVELLLADPRVEVEVVPALSFLDLTWARLGVDPFATGVRVVDGHRFAEEAAGERGPLLVGQCDSPAVLSAVKLAFDDVTPGDVVVLQRLGLPDESIRTIAWSDLDRTDAVVPDHLTSLWIPSFAAPVASELVAFAEVVRRLREECPWDRVQTHASLTRYVLEEAYEVVDAIHSGSVEHLEEELGDLLLQVVLHSAIATQAGDFTLADVARTITEKMVRRHPHVFGDMSVRDADEVHRNWEAIKQAEKPERTGALDGIPGSLPALSYAAKLSKRAAGAGFDWRVLAPVFDKVREELVELEEDPSADELGDVLFSVVNVARHLGHDPEAALRGAATKFRRRFELVEAEAAAGGIDLATAEESVVDDLWERAKAQLASSP
jgi:tetrapyrrole methylase family protein/MazG family protein